jgi:hypothetical protein
MALFQLHNFLKDIGEADLPDIGSGLGERQEGELLRAVGVIPDGYNDNYHPSNTFHTKEADLVHCVWQGQCPIRDDITSAALERSGTTRPDPGNNALVRHTV